MRLVLVEWVDSFGCSSSWQSIAVPFAAPTPMVCRSVGWLAFDGDKCKVLIPHLAEVGVDEPAQGCGDMTIPVEAIRRLVDLSEQAVA